MKRFLVTGAAGMVGRAVIEEIAANHKDEIEVFASDLFLDTLLPYESEHVHIFLNDSLESVMQHNSFDCLLQLAFPRNVQPDQWAPGIQFSFYVFGLARRYNVGRIIHVSSQSLYGWQREGAADESCPVQLVSPYTTGKYCTEVLLDTIFSNTPHTNVRLSTIIGPYTKERVTNKFLQHVIDGEDINVQGGGQVFSFCDVRDAASGFVTIMNSDRAELRPLYNLGTREYATLLEIAHYAVAIGQKYGYNNTKVNLQEADIVMNNKIVVTAMEEDFGWKAKYSIKDSMEHIFTFLRQ